MTNIFGIIKITREDMPISGLEMCKLFLKLGYKIVPGGGKGSHIKLKRSSSPTIVIPNHKELATGIEHALRKKAESTRGITMKYHFKIHREGNVYWAQGIELETCFTQADTLKELKKNMAEALNFFIDEPADSNDLAPLPDESIQLSGSVVEVELDPFIAFAFLVRRCRIMHGYTQREVAEKMGFEQIYSYQRLESSKSNPSLRIISRLKKIFPELSLDIAIA